MDIEKIQKSYVCYLYILNILLIKRLNMIFVCEKMDLVLEKIKKEKLETKIITVSGWEWGERKASLTITLV